MKPQGLPRTLSRSDEGSAGALPVSVPRTA